MTAKKPLGIVLSIILVMLASFLYYYYCLDNDRPLQACGTIEATTVEINARINGTIESLPVEEGQQVEEGHLLAVLSRNDLQVQRERDALGVEAALARYNDLLAGFSPEEIAEAAANCSLAQANLAQAEVDLSRAEQLFDAGTIAQEKLETAQLNHTTREKQAEVAQARLRMLEAGYRPEVITAAAAELKRTEAVLKTTEVMLEDLHIRSPLDGTITAKNYEVGEYIPAGAALLSICDLNNLWIKVYIPADDLPAVKLNQTVEVTVSGNDRVFNGSVSHIASRGEFTPKTIQTEKERANVVFAVKVLVTGGEQTLKPGMPADVTFAGS